MKRLHLVLFFLFFNYYLHGQQASNDFFTFLITDSTKSCTNLAKNVLLHPCKNKPSLGKIMRDSLNYPFKPNFYPQLNLKFTEVNDGYWAYFKIINTLEISTEMFLEFQNPLLKELEFFEIKEKIDLHNYTGTNFPFASRLISHNYFVFPIKLKAKEEKDFYVYLHNAGVSIKVPLMISKPSFFWQKTIYSQIILAFYAGAIFILTFVLLFLFAKVKNILVGYLSMYVLLWGLFTLNNTGFAFQFFWSNVPTIAQNAESFLSLMLILISLRIAYHFLEEYNYAQNLLNLIQMPTYLFTFLLIITFFVIYFESNWGYFLIGNIIFFILLFSQIGLILTFMIVLIRKENYEKIGLLFIFLISCVPFPFLLKEYFNSENIYYNSHLFLYTSVFLIINLSIVILYPIKYFRNEKKWEVFSALKRILNK
jgi:hypothetical protein